MDGGELREWVREHADSWDAHVRLGDANEGAWELRQCRRELYRITGLRPSYKRSSTYLLQDALGDGRVWIASDYQILIAEVRVRTGRDPHVQAFRGERIFEEGDFLPLIHIALAGTFKGAGNSH